MSLDVWEGKIGDEYHDDNPHTVVELEDMYRSCYGVTRRHLNETVIGDLPRSVNILEVGAGCAMQMTMLRKMGFSHLFGIEPNRSARTLAVDNGFVLVKGNGFNLPFDNNSFDVVYTSGVLIHIAPDDLPKIMDEMARVSRQYIWGFEYYGEFQEVEFRRKAGEMFVDDYAAQWMKHLGAGWTLKRHVIIGHTENCKRDAAMYLIERKS